MLPMTFYRWYARLQAGGPEALEDKPFRFRRVWNRIPEAVREQIVGLAGNGRSVYTNWRIEHVRQHRGGIGETPSTPICRNRELCEIRTCAAQINRANQAHALSPKLELSS